MPKKMSSVQYKKIRREDIMDFVNELYECQNHYIELAVEKSGFKEANEVIKYIMEKK
jgi:2-oxo-4-hydroxy-4-carboxy--5-ureidoimidazoline (OHCU) decarboxylase